MRIFVIALVMLLVGGGGVIRADDVDERLPSLRVVLFTPKDVSPPEDAVERLTEIATYTERFFVDWMTHCEYEPARKTMFQWEPNGDVEVLFAQGDRPAAEYTDGSFRPQMVQQLVRRHQIPRNANIWWTFVYLGDPPARYSNFRGAGNPIQGGWALANYDSSSGEILVSRDIAAGFHHDIALKGTIHELGHGLGLPHLGPRIRRDLGNSLMGPINNIWARYRGPQDRRGYLTEASAAMLWKHPLFSGTTEDRNVKPVLELHDYQAEHDRRGQQITVTGRLAANRAAHSVIVVDDMDDKPGEYWKRAYVGRIDGDGKFSVTLDELVPSGGTFRIVFCFDNGIVTGDGDKQGLVGAIEKTYQYVRRTYQFD